MSEARAPRRYAAALSLLCIAAGNARADDEDWSFASPGDDSSAGHGQVSIGFQTAHTESLVNQDGVYFNNDLSTDLHSLTLGVDYWIADQWSVHASLPFIRKRALSDPRNHDQNRLVVPHPESTFIDDGRYHSDWQDWSLGVEYHTSLGAFDITPHLYLTYPSHDYVFFASAAVGQNIWKARLGADVSQRIGQSNLHYSVGYSYEFVERILDINADRQHLRLSAWYDFSPRLSVRAFAHARKGRGLTNAEVRARDPTLTSELWYQHDRLLTYDYAIAGLGSTLRLNEKWLVSGSAATMVWVRVNHDLKYAYDLQLTRKF